MSSNLPLLKRMEKGIKILFFNAVRLFLKKGRALPPVDPSKIQRVLLLRPESKLGDMVISLPTAEAIKRRFPHIAISIICSPRNAVIIQNDPRFDTIYLYTKSIWKDWKTIRTLRAQKFDCVIDLLINDSVTSLMLSQLCGKQAIRIGAGKPDFGVFYDFHLDVPLDNEDQIILSTLKTLRPLGVAVKPEDGYSEVFTGKAADSAAERFLEGKRKSDGLLFGYNASAGSANRVWALERSRGLLEQLLAAYPNVTIIVFTTPSERERGEAIAAGFDSRVALVPPNLSILEAAAVIRQLDLLISPDTSLVHIARGFKVSVVAMMPNKTLRRWRPYGQEIGMVVCKTGDHIHDISVEEVFSMVQRMMAEQRKTAVNS